MFWIWKFFKFLWRALNFIRRLSIGLYVLVMLCMVLFYYVMPTYKPVIRGGSLMVNPWGSITEQQSVDNSRGIRNYVAGTQPTIQASLRDIVDAIRIAKTDDDIENIVLDLSGMTYAGLPQMEEISKAIHDFRDSGKKVYAYSKYYSQRQYYLAAQADEVYMHPDAGRLPLNGFGVYTNYFLDAINNLELTVHVFRVGKYKSAVEPYLRNDMSPEAKEATREWLDDQWSEYLNGVARGRGIEASTVRDYALNKEELMRKANGDFAVAAKKAGLVTDLMTFAQFNRRMIGIVGGEKRGDDEYQVFNSVDYRSYMQARRPKNRSENLIAVVVVEGEIRPGYSTKSVAGSASVVKKLQMVESDERYKAVLLRVDSPGGSSFASEEIRQAILEVKNAGKPVVASFGNVAASGGYWISMSTDEIWAAPTTMTGSIGVFSVDFRTPKVMKRVGVQVDGVGTTPFAGRYNRGREMSPELKRLRQASVDASYDQFISLAAKARGMDKAKMDSLAQGRAWSGIDAKRHGLVDKLGSFSDAVESLAKRVSIQGDYKLDYVDYQYSWLGSFLGGVQARVDYLKGDYVFGQFSHEVKQGPLAVLWESVENSPLTKFVNTDPRYIYARCLLCEVK